MSLRPPGVYIEEIPSGARPITAVGTSTAGFVGNAPKQDAPKNIATAVNNWTEFQRTFVGDKGTNNSFSRAVYGFFENGGGRCYIVNVGNGPLVGDGADRVGLQLLEELDEIAIVAAPGRTTIDDYTALQSHCENMKDRVAILDAPANVANIDHLTIVATSAPAPAPATDKGKDKDKPTTPPRSSKSNKGVRPPNSNDGFSAFYFPWLRVRGTEELVPPSGHIAGIWARSDATRGVHKAPANETVRGATGLAYRVTRDEQGKLNDKGVNCIRYFSNEGILVWGARTTAPSSSPWRYINVRRLFNMIEESIAENTRWTVFEPNDRPLWQSIRRDVTAFLIGLWRDGALMGSTPEEAFYVKCDAETNTPDQINLGRVITEIGIAPVKPAEFIIFRVHQYEGGTETEEVGG